MPNSLIIGYGNTIRSDDGAGHQAALALEHELSSPTCLIVAAQQLTPEMAEPISHASRTLFLDASHDGIPGEIRYEGVLRDPYFQPGAVTHHLTPSSLLELAWRYFQAQPKASLLTLTGANFELGEEFSPQVTAAWSQYLDRIRAWAKCS